MLQTMLYNLNLWLYKTLNGYATDFALALVFLIFM